MNNKKTIYAVCLLLLVTVMTIGYALISGTLNINGNAKITAATWEIYFKNVEIKDGSVTATQEPTITDKTSLSYNIKLKKPGDYFEFNVDVVNNGDLDAMIDKITITPDISDKPYLSYTVKYLDDSDVEAKDILHSKKARTIKVRVEFKEDIENNELNKTDEELNIVFSMKYVQADATGKEPTAADKPTFKATIVNGSGTNVGDEISIGDEHFYVVSNDGKEIVMLSKYNLNVGNTCSTTSGSSCVAITNPTGIQSSSRMAWRSSGAPYIGGAPFSETYYWGSVSSGEYVYDNRASISQYVDNYKKYLETLGAYIIEARLIKYSELRNVGCSSTCYNAPSWVKSTSYWTGSAVNSTNILAVFSDGDVHQTNNATNRNYFGVRPVIVISADAIN